MILDYWCMKEEMMRQITVPDGSIPASALCCADCGSLMTLMGRVEVEYKVGLDFDGVLADFDWEKYRVCKTRKEIEAYYRGMEPLKIPDIPANSDVTVISFRHKHFYLVTLWWLRKILKKDWPLILLYNGGYHDYTKDNRELRHELKAAIINKKKLDFYYEDDPEIVESLVAKCPETKIIRVGNRGGCPYGNEEKN